MTTLDRGFKAWAERTSLAFRQQLNLAPDDPLSGAELATHVGVTLWVPSDIPGLQPQVLKQLLEADPWGWSAVSLVLGEERIIIYNPRKSAGRRASDIAHELAHFILEHRPATLIVSTNVDMAMRTFDAKQEDEANWLAWCLLLPREALVRSKLRRLSIAGIAERYGVSEVLVKMRMDRTGVSAQFKAAKRRVVGEKVPARTKSGK